MNRIAMDFRHALRLMGRRPGFSFFAVAVLALGIGANAALFSVVYGVLLRPLPYPESERLHWIQETSPEDGGQLLTSFDNFADWKRGSRLFEGMTAYAFDNFNLTGGRSPAQVRAARVAEGFFAVMGVQPILGGVFDASDNGPEPARVVILGEPLWKRQFGADADIVGREIELDGKPWTVRGVMPAAFDFPTGWDLWVPLGDLGGREKRTTRRLWAVGRLKPGVTRERAQTEMDALAARLAAEHPVANRGHGVRLVSLREQMVGDVRATLLLLFAAVGLVLVIACGNIANLLLAKSRERQREMSVRLAIGAGRGHILSQLLTESLVLAGLGGLVGWAVALWSLDGLLALAPADLPRVGEIRVDWRVFVFSMGAAVCSGVFFGLFPAWQALGTDVASSLKDAARLSNRARARTRRLLVVGQMALALTVLSGAVLIVRSLLAISSVEPGFARDVLTLGLVLPPNEYSERSRRIAFFDESLARLRSLPGVEAAAAANFLPTHGLGVQVEAKTSEMESPVKLAERVVTPDFFATVGIPVLSGRDFSSADGAEALQVAILNKLAAERLWPGGDPLGKDLQVNGSRGTTNRVRVVGVVENILPSGLTAPPVAEIYLAYAQNPWAYMNLAVRAERGDALQLLPSVREAVWEVDPRRPFFAESTLGDALDRISLAEPRFRAFLLGLFALLAAILAAAGLYGVVAGSVSGRRREIGTRMALGARPGHVLRLVMGEGLAMAALGVLAGVGVSLLAGRLLSGTLYGVTVQDPITLLAAAGLLAVPVGLASALPAMRAVRLDPARALRRE